MNQSASSTPLADTSTAGETVMDKAIEVRADSSALKTVIEAETAKLREALERISKYGYRWILKPLDTVEIISIADAALAASAQAQDSPKAETLTPSTGDSREEIGNVAIQRAICLRANPSGHATSVSLPKSAAASAQKAGQQQPGDGKSTN